MNSQPKLVVGNFVVVVTFVPSGSICPSLGVIRKEEEKELGNSIEGALEEYGGQWVGGLNGLLGDTVSFI